jgi:sugar phosphate permease
MVAMGDVEPHESGLASGLVNTAFSMGGALGLAILVSVSQWRTGSLAGSDPVHALDSGFQWAFAAGAAFALVAALIGAVALRRTPGAAVEEPAAAEPVAA